MDWRNRLTKAVGADDFVRGSEGFLRHVFAWANALPAMSLGKEMGERRLGSADVAVVCIDLIEGFCRLGPLASERVLGIVPNVVDLLALAHGRGIENFVLIEERHNAKSREFGAFPSHGVAGTAEARTVRELAELPFASKFEILGKNSVSPAIGTGFEMWLEAHSRVNEFICTGDVTDMCLYQLATYLNTRANAFDRRDVRVVVPANCTQTYDLPLDAAPSGAVAHDADLMHVLFLYHLAISGVTVVRGINP